MANEDWGKLALAGLAGALIGYWLATDARAQGERKEFVRILGTHETRIRALERQEEAAYWQVTAHEPRIQALERQGAYFQQVLADLRQSVGEIGNNTKALVASLSRPQIEGPSDNGHH